MSPSIPQDRLDVGDNLVRSTASDRAIRRMVADGTLLSLTRGCHVVRSVWDSAGPDDRFRLRIAAGLSSCVDDPVLSHAAAAFVWDLPWTGPWPARVSATDPTRPSTRSGALMRWHAQPLAVGDVARYGDVAVTTPVRTGVDLALALPFGPAVVVLDGVLNSTGATPADLAAALEGRAGARRSSAAARAVAFADGGGASAGESLSRISMASSEFVVPVLQKRFDDAQGLVGFVDFWWPAVGVVGEFDGDKKYLRSAYRGGRTIEQVLLDEKRRQDRLVALGEVRRVVRWGWKEAQDPELLASRLSAVGVPRCH